MPDPRESDWSRAGIDLETLRLILLLAYEFEEQTGRRMTATELRASLRQPS